MQDSWKYIPGFDQKYQISSSGQVKSVTRNSKLVARQLSKQRCAQVMLTKDSKANNYYLDELVAKTFLAEEWFEYCKVIHIDGDINNNHVTNLRCIDPVPDLPGEIWSTVAELEGHVVVSNLGRVKRIDHHGSQSDHLFKFYTDADGYFTFGISIDGHIYSYRVHRLVANAFIPHTDDSLEVNHIDGNKQNNCVANLEWCTKTENMQHAVALGLCKNDGDCMKSINRELRSTKIECIESGLIFNSIKEAADYYDVSWSTVADIVHGRTNASNQLPGVHFSIIKKGDKTK